MVRLRSVLTYPLVILPIFMVSFSANAQSLLKFDDYEPSLLIIALVAALTSLAAFFALFLYRLLFNPKNGQQNNQIGVSAGKRAAIVFNIILAFLISSLAWWALNDIEATIKNDKRESLKTVLHTTLEAMNIWANEQSNIVNYIADNPEILNNTYYQLGLYEQGNNFKSGLPLETLRQKISVQLNRNSLSGFFIITKDGINIASMQDDNLGNPNPIFTHRPDLLERAFQGETVFVPPIPSDTKLDGLGLIRGKKVSPVLFFVGPIRDEFGNIIAALSLRHDPQAEFSRINLFGRIGQTGETYSFDNEGNFLSKSRFEHQLIRLGLLDHYEQSILSIQIRNPGVNLVKGETTENVQGDLPLTLMASHATRKEEGFNVEGYPDYRGVPVIGAWIWDSNLGFGMASEVDLTEAMAAYTSARFVVIMIVLITLIVSIAFTILSIILGNHANQSLQEAHDQLEGRVQERTKELESALESLTESEERFVLALRATNEGLWDWNYKTNVVFYNKRWLNMLGYENNELPGTMETWEKLCHPDDIEGALKEIEATLDGHQAGFTIEFRMRHKEGRWVPILSRAYVVRDGLTKDVNRIVGTHIDMTQEKQAAYALKEAKEETERAFVELLKEKKKKAG